MLALFFAGCVKKPRRSFGYACVFCLARKENAGTKLVYFINPSFLIKLGKRLFCWGLLGIISCSGDQTTDQVKNLEIEITGSDYQWHYLYPGPDGQLHTADDIETHQAFHLPVKTNVSLILSSKDFIYTFSLPDFSAKEMAIPGLNNQLSFFTKRTGTFDLIGDQMCGYSHESLMGALKIQRARPFQNWLMSNTK